MRVHVKQRKVHWNLLHSLQFLNSSFSNGLSFFCTRKERIFKKDLAQRTLDLHLELHRYGGNKLSNMEVLWLRKRVFRISVSICVCLRLDRFQGETHSRTRNCGEILRPCLPVSPAGARLLRGCTFLKACKRRFKVTLLRYGRCLLDWRPWKLPNKVLQVMDFILSCVVSHMGLRNRWRGSLCALPETFFGHVLLTSCYNASNAVVLGILDPRKTDPRSWSAIPVSGIWTAAQLRRPCGHIFCIF
jgi:hypothetical protein